MRISVLLSKLKVEPTSLILATILVPAFATAMGNQKISSFQKAKKIAAKIHKQDGETIYCPCRFSGKTVDLASCGYKIQKDAKRARQLEWEHVVPAEAFGQAFLEWREGSSQCVSKKGKRFKGRRCAQTNPEFAKMEADLYNLWPSIGELNGLRSNFSMAQISGEYQSFGGCKAKIADRKFEPMDRYKGIVARVYQYMDHTYPGRGVISAKNRQLFEVWDKQHPVTDWECLRSDLVRQAQGNENPVLKAACGNRQATQREPATATSR